jgi:hypothetical protein
VRLLLCALVQIQPRIRLSISTITIESFEAAENI